MATTHAAPVWSDKTVPLGTPSGFHTPSLKPRRPSSTRFIQPVVKVLAYILTGVVFWKALFENFIPQLSILTTHDNSRIPPSGVVSWRTCGKEYGNDVQCADIAVPLDYRNSSDGRTMTLAVARLLAADKENRKGAIFLNPGGPGGPGTYTAKHGQALARVVKGQYDLIGFDPRGVGASRPYVSCFDSALDSEAFEVTADDFSLNLPANFSAFDHLQEDFDRQINSVYAYMTSLAKHCVQRSGDILPYIGTEFVVKDIEFLSRLIEGEDVRINYWGFSYGTVIGQYLVKILAPERLGRIIIDGVVDAAGWNLHADHFFKFTMFEDVNNLLFSFASSCLQAGSACALTADSSITSIHVLLAKIETLLDNLYAKPVPAFGLDVPAVATTADLRTLLFHSMYQPKTWVNLAQRLSEAFQGDFSEILKETMPRVHQSTVDQPEFSTFSTHAIACADAAPYTDAHPSPSDKELANILFKSFGQSSRTYGDGHWSVSLCHLWTKAGLQTTRSHYNGTLDLVDDTLETPMLILSNTFDPITPLSNAIAANQRLGTNARLIQQTGGWGHCTASHPSSCTALAIRNYFLDGKLPFGKHTTCDVDKGPFDPAEVAFRAKGEEAELQVAWTEFSRSTNWVF